MCSRQDAYRLARLADKYGSEIEMRDLLAYLAGDCRQWKPRHPGVEGCGAHFCDLGSGRAPDMPDKAATLRIIK